MASAQFITKALDENDQPTFDWSKAVKFIPISISNSVSVIGIISAMDNEIALLLKQADIDHVDHIGDMDFHVGELCGKQVVIVKSGIGKVRAAAGIAAMLDTYNLSKVFFTGIAGVVGDETEVLDVVVATELVQHDYGQITNDGFEWYEGYGGDHGYYPCDSPSHQNST